MKAIESPYSKREKIATGIVAFDSLLGGGIEVGSITEFFGTESVGKSTLALQVIASAQEQGIECLFADTEFQFNVDYASALGVDCSQLELVQHRIGEETFDEVEKWAAEKRGTLMVLDSMGGILAKEEAEKTAEDRTIGLQSRLMGAHCRKIIGLLAEGRHAYIIVNHELVDLNTGKVGSSGGKKLAHHKRNSIRFKPLFGKVSSRATDGSKRNKHIEAEIKKEKGMDLKEGTKAALLYEKGRGFVNEATEVKRGRPPKVLSV